VNDHDQPIQPHVAHKVQRTVVTAPATHLRQVQPRILYHMELGVRLMSTLMSSHWMGKWLKIDLASHLEIVVAYGKPMTTSKQKID